MDPQVDTGRVLSAEPDSDKDFEFTELESRLSPGLLAACDGCSGCSNPGCSSCSVEIIT